MGNQVSQVVEFDPDRVRPLPRQPRKRFRGIKALAESIAEVGQQQAGIVTLLKDDPDHDAQLVDGERRLRACYQAGVKFKAVIRTDCITDDEKFVASFVTNFNKQEHDRMEVAEGLFRMQAMGISIERLAKISGKSTCWVSQHLSLLKLDLSVQAMMIPQEDEQTEGNGDIDESESPSRRKHLTFSLALLLVSFPPQIQIQLAQKIVKEDMSLAAARRMILREMEQGREDGLTNQKRQHKGKQRRLDGLASTLVDLSDKIGIYQDMRLSQFNELVDGVETKRKTDVLQTIDGIVEELNGLARRIRARMRIQNMTPRETVVA